MSTEINLINKIVVLDEGTILTSDARSLNFTGPGVTATSLDGDVTIDITGGGAGSVTDVTASSPLSSTGGTTPDISIQQASALQAGYLSSTDWTTFNNKVSSSLLGANNGVATLDSGGKVPVTQLPNSIMDYKGTYDIITNTPTLVNGTGNAGDVYINTAAGTRDFGAGPITVAIGDWLVYDGSVWQKSVNSNAVASVNGYTGIVVLNKSDIGLSNVENTALSTWAGSSNITTVGTIGSGIWNGTPIGDSYLSSSFVKTNGTTPLTADWNAGSFRITTGNITSTGDALVNNLTVGKGSGSISSNTALGFQALNANTTGADSVVIGYQAGVSNTTASRNVVIGYQAQYSGTTGSADNIAIGYKALYTNTNAWSNTALGSFAATANTTGNNLVAVGKSALAANTTGYQNTAVGSSALSSNTTGNSNVAVGKGTLSASTTGSGNTAVGNGALIFNTTGSGNASFALESLANNTTGYNNAAYGSTALLYNTTGYRNTAIGNSALYSNITGQSNVSLGYEAGAWTAGGSVLFPNNTPQQSVFLGASTKSLNATDTNQIVIGYNVTGNGTNTTTIGLQGTTTDTWLAGYLHINSAYKLPNADGTNGQILQTDGAGNATWQNSSGGGGTVTSVGLSMPSAFSVANSPITGAGTIAVTGAGTTAQYVRGDGTLGILPSSGGAGGGTVYYLNGNTSQGVISGTTMYQLSKAAGTGAAANFNRSTVGTLASFITDAGDPNQLVVPAGIWLFQCYLSETGGGATHAEVSAIVEKWNGSTITVLGTGTVEEITNGSIVDLYSFGVSIPTGVTLSLTDRIVIQLQVSNPHGKTVTLYTENSNISSVSTTFANGIASLNGLTASAQTFATGTTGTDFGISSSSSIHTFNLPTASATNRGALSSANWSTFNSKVGGSGTTNYISKFTAAGTIGNSMIIDNGSVIAIGGGGSANTKVSIESNLLYGFSVQNTVVGGVAAQIYATGAGTGDNTALSAFAASGTGTNTAIIATASGPVGSINYAIQLSDGTEGTGKFLKSVDAFGSANWATLTVADTGLTLTTTGSSGSASLVSNTLNVPTYTLAGLGGITLSSLSANTPLSYNTGTGAFSIQVATTAQNGYLSFADWNTFSGKVGGSGTANYVSKFTAGGTIGNSLIQDNGTTVGIGIAPSSTTMLRVAGSAGAYYGVYVQSIFTGGVGGTFIGTNGVKGDASGNGVTSISRGGEFNATDSVVNIGVVGAAGVTTYASTTNIGGQFVASDATTNYAVQLIDGSEGIAGRFLKDVTGSGHANWATLTVANTGLTVTTTGTSGAATLVGNTLNIPQYTGGTGSFDYGLSYAMASQNILL